MNSTTTQTQFSRLRALSAIDAESVVRDPMLRWLVVLPLGIALVVRVGLPLVLAQLGRLAGQNLGWLQAPLAAYINVSLAPMLAGSVVGFLLLDQRDDGTLLALRVTPLAPDWYVAYRLAAPLIVATLMAWLALLLSGSAGLTAWTALLAAAGAAPLAPLIALALAVAARNKVEGFAFSKAASVLQVAPLAMLFLPASWQLWFAP
ncbi:MAG TPA: hypothetical protein VFT99_08880, partial [Roseiflexaceae bacterium]|nr:hypothetical protein [Roseiflexaceae bacterium]